MPVLEAASGIMRSSGNMDQCLAYKLEYKP